MLTDTTVILHKKYYPQKGMSTRELRESLVFSLTDHPAEEALRPGGRPCSVTGRTMHSLVELDGPETNKKKTSWML